jgi:hypothetical protein
MTEAEWLAATDPSAMLESLLGNSSDRKLRLFNCYCCRRLSSAVRGYMDRAVLEAAEHFAEVNISSEEMEAKRDMWYDFHHPYPLPGTWQRALDLTTMTDSQIRIRLIAATVALSSSDQKNEAAVQANLLRELFGPFPFSPVILNPSWLTSTVLALARGIYQEKAFDRMPILADALQDAGCDNEEILNHCRQQGEHVRGCWVVDLLLNKT